MILLAGLLQEVVDKHSDKEVLETCAKTLERLCDDRHAIYSRCDIARSRLLDMVSSVAVADRLQILSLFKFNLQSANQFAN